MIRRLLDPVPFPRASVGLPSLVVAGLLVIQGLVSPMATAQSPLVAHYTFDDPAQFTAGPIIDSSGNGLNGTVQSAITWNASGVSGGAMTSNLSPNFTTDLSTAGIAGDQFTISFWLKTGASSSSFNYNDWGQVTFSNGTTSQVAQLRGLPNPSGFYWRDTSLPFNQTTPGNLKNDAWHMVTVSVDPVSDEMTIFLDGGNASVFTGYPRTPAFAMTALQIGRGLANGYPGLMDDVQVYSSPLPAVSVATMYANPGLAATDFSVWDAAANDNAWLTAANWSSVAATALPGETGNASSTDSRVAIIGDYAFTAANGLGIDMSAAGANGVLAMGGISFDSTSGNLRVGNSAADTSGTLRLNGATVGGALNTVLSVSGSSDLTIGDTASGSGTQTMGVELTAATNVMNVAAGRMLTVETAISESGASSSIQKTGSGTLVLSGTNVFTGGTTISGGAVVAAADGALGSGSITLAGGTLRHAATSGLPNAITLSGDAAGNTIDFGAQLVEYLIVGGGGGGGPTSGDYPAGGGGGEVLAGSLIPVNVSDIVVGTGGAYLADGTASTALGLTANPGLAGLNNASTGNNSVGGTSGSGFVGGSGYDGGGGGGAGGNGTNEDSIGSRLAGIGGDGIYSSITGTQVGYGGGGAGGYPTGWGSEPRGGQNYGGGGPGVAGTANTGGGGGGATAGGSGVVIVRYQGDPAAAGGTIDTVSVPGYTIHTFSSGSDQLAFSPKSVELSGDISGSGGFTFDAAGTLTLSGNNTYAGGTIVTSGTLEAASATALGSGGITTGSGGTVRITAPGIDAVSLPSIAGSGTLDAGLHPLIVGSDDSSTTYSGPVTAASLTKQGSGVLELAGSNSFGGTTVSTGTLIARTNDALGSGTVTIGNGRLQAGNGTSLTNDIQLTGSAELGLAPLEVEYLIVGGGGGSNAPSNGYSAGGGGGQVLSGQAGVAAATSTIVVGAGGAYGFDGESSSAFGFTAGPGLKAAGQVGGASGAGFTGGTGYDGGGGGGAGGNGINEDSIGSRLAGIGGDGIYSSITGTQVGYGGGGAGGFATGWGSTPRGGQNFGGGAPSVDGEPNTGGGAGGYRAGGSGVVIVRYQGTPVGTGGTIDTASVPGSTIHAFTDVGESTFTLAGVTSTISGVVSGSGSLSFAGANGSLTLSGNNTYSGGTVVSAGTLTVGSATALGTGPLAIAAGGTVAFDAPGVSAHSLPSVSGGGALSAAGKALTFGAGNTDSSFSGTIVADSLAKEGSGQLALSGSNTIGGTTLTSGSLVAAGSSLGSGAITIDGGTLRAVSGATFTNAMTLSAAASSVTLGLAVPELEYLVVGGGGGPGGGVSGQAYNGGGGGGAVQTGTLTGLTSNAFEIIVGAGGGTNAPGGTSSAFGFDANGGGQGVVTGTGGTSGSGFAGAGRAGVEAGGGGGAGGAGLQGVGSGTRIGGDGGPGLPSDITGTTVYYGGGGAGGGGGSGPGTGGLGGGAGRNGDATPNSGGGGRGAGAGGFADAAGADGVVIVRYAGAAMATGGTVDSSSVPGYTLHTFTDVGNQSLTFGNFAAAFSGDLSGTGGFTWDSVGTLTLSGNNSYQGGTIVNAGTLTAGSASAFGSGTITLSSGTTIDLGGYAIANTITNNGGTILNAGNYAGSQSVDGDATFDGDVGGTVEIAAGGVGRFRGQVGGRVEIASGGIAELDDSASVGSGADFVNNGVLRSNRTTDLTIGRPITGSGSLQKQGAGRLVLSGVNTYSGGTTVDAGALVVNGSIPGDVGLAAGSRLGGSGTIGGTVSGGGVFGPGNSPGITTVGSIDPSGGLSFELEITGSLADWDAPTASVNDVIRLTDATPFTASMSAGNTISVLLDVAGGDPAAPGTYTGGFFTDTAADFTSALANASFDYWVAGEFGSLGDRQQFATGSGGAPEWYTRLAAYDPALSVQWSTVPTTADFGSGAVSGYSTEFVVVPEPGTLALAGCGLAVATALLRRRRTA